MNPLRILTPHAHLISGPQWPANIFSLLAVTSPIVNRLTATVAICVHTAIKHPVPDLVKPSFVIFGIRAL